MPVRKLTSEQRLSRAIDIMEALYAAGESGMTRTEICSRFDITGVSLDEILEIVSTLADRESGRAHHLRMPRRACGPHR